jgi:tRNA pseudouridine55 synthase
MTVTGILNVNKPRGPTSHDIVALVRRLSGERKVGHGGTLDPLASGVLIICLGQATRITEYVMELTKVYRATLRLGVATDTLDSEGKVVATSPPPAIGAQEMRSVLDEFVGEVELVPPAYSAVKVDGQPAYKLARRGSPPQLPARLSRVYRIELLRLELPELDVEVECARGTYVRALAAAIGQRLGCGAHVARLTRTAVGPFTLDTAMEPGELERRIRAGDWKDLLQPLDSGLANLPAMTVDIEDEKDLRHGQAVELRPDSIRLPCPIVDGLQCRAYAEDGSLVAIIAYDAGAKLWRPRRVFLAPSR